MGHYWNDTDKGKPRYTGKKKLPPRNEVWAIVGLFKTDFYPHYIHKTLIPTSTKSISTTRMDQFILFRKTIGVD
jgi:hypothetical protein